MSLAQNLADFKASVAQCDSLIANAHKVDGSGAALFPPKDQQQITVAAFLNLFIAWETFLECSLAELMTGAATLNGTQPVKYVSPLTPADARQFVKHVREYFDYGNHEYFRIVVNQYFKDGYPYEPHFKGITLDLADLRKMRNASAHISHTTQSALETLALRVLKRPSIGIELYALLMASDPAIAGNTIFTTYRDKLVVTAELIAQG